MRTRYAVTKLDQPFAGGIYCWQLWRKTKKWACIASGYGYDTPAAARKGWREFRRGVINAKRAKV